MSRRKWYGGKIVISCVREWDKYMLKTLIQHINSEKARKRERELGDD